jgi:hypothetical protein
MATSAGGKNYLHASCEPGKRSDFFFVAFRLYLVKSEVNIAEGYSGALQTLDRRPRFAHTLVNIIRTAPASLIIVATASM